MPHTGDVPPNPLEKAGYVLEFHDEFDDPVLNTGRWLPFYLPHWSSREQSKPQYEIRDGCLVLHIVENHAPWCPEFDGEVRVSSIQTGTYSGDVGGALGQHRFSDACVVREPQTNAYTYLPQFGYFETRVKGLATGGNHVSLWMIGYEDTPERSAEIAMFELLGTGAGQSSSTVRYGMHPWGDPHITDEFYEDRFGIDTTQFHIYALEWTPTHIDFYVDNAKVRTIHQSPQYPMQLMLSIYELPFEGAWSGPYNPADPYPRQFVVDYVRAYQPEGGYHRDGR